MPQTANTPQTAKQERPGNFDLQRYLGILRRRHLHFLISMFLGWVAVWGASWFLPPRYESNTLILVEHPTMPKEYVVPNVAQDVQDRLQSISQQILSRSRLLHIIDELSLYPKDRARLAPDQIVERMRKDITIEIIKDKDNDVSAFKVSYSGHDPSVTQQVTSKLTSLFIGENLEARQQESQGTTNFMADQLEAARQTLAVQEDKIRAYKAQHVGELPTQLGSNLQILSGLQSQLQAQEEALNTTKQQHVYLETLLNQYRALQGPVKSPEGARMGLAAIDQELDKLRKDLADLSSSYKDQYPEVRNLKDQIAKTEKMREEILADLKTKGNGTQPSGNEAAPAYDGSNAKDPSLLPQLQSQLQANQAEIRNRGVAIASLSARINAYQARLNQGPVREQELADLTRDYDQSKATYDELLKKKSQSAMATSMELLQKGERFRILDPPSLSLRPSFPNHLKFWGIGLLVGLALGLVVAGASEKMDDQIYSEQELKKLLPVSVITEIPVISNPTNEKAEQKMVWIGWATAAVVFVIILAGSAFSYLRG